MEGENVIVLEGSDREAPPLYMADLSMNRPLFNPFDDDRFTYNDHGTAAWYQRKYPGFPEHYYPVFELYSLGGVRAKQLKTHIKKLKKKGKFKADEKTPESILEQFQKTSIQDEIISA